MNLRWFFSSRVRNASERCDHIQKLFNAQRDLMSASAVEALQSRIGETRRAIEAGQDLENQIEALEEVAGRHLKPYPNAEWRENIEVFLVAIAVAMAIRTFFIQPFKIPTGSMQPTLFGITMEDLGEHPEAKVPGLLDRIKDAVIGGVFYHTLQAADDGEIVDIPPPSSLLHVITKQDIRVRYTGGGRERNETLTLWFAPSENFERASRLRSGQTFSKGDWLVRLKEVSGDHLFVDRFTYNFRKPKRGEIVVFQTRGIEALPQDQFYIKRLVALPGEKVQIGEDRHLVIDGNRLDASTPHFGKVYSFKGPPMTDRYSGHVNVNTARYSLTGVTYFYPNLTYQVRPNHYMVMGDNTMNSSDGRFWGDFPESNVIGKSFFVYWPISNHDSSRFGWSVE